jgi:hypothetical protein
MTAEERAALVIKLTGSGADPVLLAGIVQEIQSAEKAAWNTAVAASANKLVQAMGAQNTLRPVMGDAFDEIQCWGKLMVFSIKDLLKP